MGGVSTSRSLMGSTCMKGVYPFKCIQGLQYKPGILACIGCGWKMVSSGQPTPNSRKLPQKIFSIKEQI